MTDIDLASGEPANFIFKMPNNIKVVDKNGCDIYMSILAVPELTTMEMKSDRVDVYGYWSDRPVSSFTTGSTFEIGLNLRAVPQGTKKEICSLTFN